MKTEPSEAMKPMVNLLADQCWCDGDCPTTARVHIVGSSVALHITARLNRRQAVVLMAGIQAWLRATEDRSMEHFVAEVTHIAAPGPDVEVSRPTG